VLGWLCGERDYRLGKTPNASVPTDPQAHPPRYQMTPMTPLALPAGLDMHAPYQGRGPLEIVALHSLTFVSGAGRSAGGYSRPALLVG
jgi:hypothetical protein